MSEHHYAVTVTWTGNSGGGTASYRGYDREHLVEIAGKPPLRASADPSFLGCPSGRSARLAPGSSSAVGHPADRQAGAGEG